MGTADSQNTERGKLWADGDTGRVKERNLEESWILRNTFPQTPEESQDRHGDVVTCTFWRTREDHFRMIHYKERIAPSYRGSHRTLLRPPDTDHRRRLPTSSSLSH